MTQEADADELADGDVLLTKCNKRQEEYITIDATKSRHLSSAGRAGHVLAALRQNLLYRNKQVVAHHG